MSETTTFTYVTGVKVEYTGSQITSTSYAGYPSEVELGNEVTTIGASAFKDLSLNTFTIKSSNDSLLQSIGARAFQNTRLTTFTVPNSVTTIGEYAFSDCATLQTMDILPGSNLRTIGEHAFQNDQLLDWIEIPNTVVTIGDYAFNKTDISLITIPYSLNTIGNYAFSDTSLNTIKIPSSVSHIGNYAFYNNAALKNLSIVGAKLQVIGDHAFGLTDISEFTVPNSLTSIGAYAFANLTSLNKVTISTTSTLKSIGDHAFHNDANVTVFNIPDSLVNIGDYAFAGTGVTVITLGGTSTKPSSNLKTIGDFAFANTGISTINIPSSVSSIGGSAFSEIPSLELTFKNQTTTLTVDNNTFTTDAELTAMLAIYNFVKHDSR